MKKGRKILRTKNAKIERKKKEVKLNNSMTIQGAINRINEATKWLKKQDTDFRILIKQTRNLGDTLHITPIARHYKTIYPNCKIAFIVGHNYMSVHEHNKDFDMIMPINGTFNAQDRIKLGKYMKNIEGLDLILCPSIHPFGEVWKSHVWSYPQISHQYFHNGGIQPPGEIKGGGKLHAPTVKEDDAFAKKFVNGRKCIGLEYNSYSHPVGWRLDKFKLFVDLASKIGYSCISFAGKNEGIIPNTIDGRGIPWRRTISILSECDYMVGVGSGITMLACCAKSQPTLIEVGVSESILMKECGYADKSLSLKSEDHPQKAIDYIIKENAK